MFQLQKMLPRLRVPAQNLVSRHVARNQLHVGHQRLFHSSLMLNKYKVLVSDPIEDVCIQTLEEGDCIVDRREKVPPAELLEIIKDYDGLIVRSGTQVTKDVIEAGTKLKVIGRAGTGVDNIDVDAATVKGKIVMNTPGGNTASAAELTMSLLLSLCRSIPNATASMKAGKWDRKKYMGTELSGKTIGVIGLGQIGRRVALSCQGLGMKTIGYDPLLSVDRAASDNIELMSVHEVFQKADFLTFHVPLVAETKDMLNSETFKLCKPGVFIVNAARGGIINEDALLENLESGHVAGAAMDVYQTEPPPSSIKPLLDHPNVVCTPHLGASTGEAQEKVASEIASQMIDSFNGRKVNGIVNAKILSELHAHPELETYVDLAERLGLLHAQLLTGNLHQVTLVTRGPKLKNASNLLVAAALKGMLSHMVMDNVNFVNAGALAKDFGLHVKQVHENLSSVFTNSVSLIVHTDMGLDGSKTDTKRKLVGTLSNKQPRIVKFNEFVIDFEPEGHMVFFTNVDQPGVIGTVATILADQNVNIGFFALGRTGKTGRAIGVVSVDREVPGEVLRAIQNSARVDAISKTHLPVLATHTTKGFESSTPATKPVNPNFSSGPCAKHPGYSLENLDTSSLGRSHRSALGKRLLKEAIDTQKKILGIPDDYELCIVAGSDTGAFELAMWNLLGPRHIDVVQFDSFGKGWKSDIVDQLKLTDVTVHEADYGKLPDLSKTNSDNDIVFTWNGTTSGVKVPNGDWISENRSGLTLCDATSAVFAMDLPWDKLDVTTYSWQKALGGEAAHGVVVLSPRAIERLELVEQQRGLPKIFRLVNKGKYDTAIGQGSVINTPSMLCVEDLLSALKWSQRVGGLTGLIARSEANLAAVEKFVSTRDWVSFLAEDKTIRSNTSVCLMVDLPKDQLKQITDVLAQEGIAYDINSYKHAPPGIRIWCGSTVEEEDVSSLLLWIEWAYKKVKKGESLL